MRSAEQANTTQAAHLAAAELEDDALLFDAQLFRRHVGDHVAAGPRALLPEKVGKLRRAAEDSQRGAQQRGRLARERFRRHLAGERGDERRERVQALPHQALRELRRVRHHLAQPPLLEKTARRPGRRLAQEFVPCPAQRLQRFQGGFRFRRAAVGQLAAQLGLALRRIGREREPQPVGEDLERAEASALALQIGAEPGLIQHPDGAGKLAQRGQDRLRAWQEPSFALAGSRHWHEWSEQGAQSPARAERRRGSPAHVGSEHGHVVDPFRDRSDDRAGHQSVSSGEESVRSARVPAPAIRTRRPSIWTRPSAQSAMARR